MNTPEHTHTSDDATTGERAHADTTQDQPVATASTRRPLRNLLVGSRLGWALLAIVALCLVAVAGSRDSGPRTPDERIVSIASRIACPVCDGESVADSRNPTSLALMERIKIDVRAGQLSDDEIIGAITSARDGQELLVPTANGVEALAWALPAAAFAIGAVGLVVAFVRWRRQTDAASTPSAADTALVAAALLAEQHRVGSSREGSTDDGDGR